MGWLKQIFSRHRRYDEIAESIREHLEEKIEDLMEDGLSREEATRKAYREFGNVTLIEECSREVWQWPRLETLFKDLRFGARMLLKQPGFSLTAVLTLALGIGANAAIFTLLHAVLMKNLPVADPETLVRIGDGMSSGVGITTPDDGNYSVFPTAAWRLMKEKTPEFEELAAIQSGFENRPIIVRRDGEDAGARSATGEFVSGNYFKTFGLRSQAGRLFTDTDDAAGAPLTAVMSYHAWQRDY